jgi:FMN phosphatase YigB (HAD superfamily)
MIPEERLFHQEQGGKADLVSRAAGLGYDPRRISFVDDNFTNVVDVVDAPGLAGVQGFVNDWGGKFSRSDLLAEPSIAARPSIRVVDPAELRSALLPQS